MFRRIYPWQWNFQNRFCSLLHWIMPPVFIRYLPSLTVRSWTPRTKQWCGPSIVNRCQAMSGIYEAFLHSQLELSNPFPPPPKKHTKPQYTTVFNIRSFPKTLVLFHLSAKMRILGKSMNARNYVCSQSIFQKSFCDHKLVHAARWTCWDFFPACPPSSLLVTHFALPTAAALEILSSTDTGQ